LSYRVIQWATGNIGARALREVIRDPDLELVGVLVYDPEKDGLDAGVLAGVAPIGVSATTDRAAMAKLDADCVLYMPRLFDLDDVVALLASGKNVVTTRGELFAGGHRLGDEERTRILNACAEGRTSLYATGSSPGFITDTLPLALLSMQRRVDAIVIDEFADVSQRDSPHMLFRQMGFGQSPDTFDPRRSQFLLGVFAPPLGELARAAGRAVHRQLVLRHRGRAGVGTSANRLARARARRRAVRRRPHVPDSARGARILYPGVHRQSPGERDRVRVRGRTWHSVDR
jgi:4-hydroxy-tetrahydrodipicolinate reductase